ncbi:MAG: ATP-binding cassette domain-containing protein [Clostridia bacterium]|nr:ATP-binding cassette domain-containing protein [Clostridia bacterium]
MIEVKHLTKRYGGHTAVSDLSFTIEPGQIYGFLGPNGAGKSTTMNIITGCLGATDGEVLVDGHSVLDEPIEAKKCIGYLPELPPLYTDMTPMEYLRLVLRLKGVKKSDWDKQLRSVMDRTKLHDVKDRLIGNLSKGYRQRVGIAQALLGNPKVIILDEPTVGLDPAQIIEIRELIKSLGKDHTVILSSHILSEVQAVCDQIMIIAHGKLVASDTADNLTSLMASGSKTTITVRAALDETETVLIKMGGFESAEYKTCDEGETMVQILPKEGADIREKLFFAFAEAGLPILEMKQERATLEDVFLELTQDDRGMQEVNEA